MTAVTDRCHACGARRAGSERLCGKCGSDLPDVPADTVSTPAPADGLGWSYRIPIVNNRFVWIRWGWAAVAFGAGFALVLGTPLVVAFSSTSGGVAFAVKLYAAIALLAAAVVIACALYAALGVSNAVTTRFALRPHGAVATTSEGASNNVEQAVLAIGGSFAQTRNLSAAASLLLPSSWEAAWKDVRRAEFDESRHVITLRRRWHHPVRLYVPPERFDDAAAFVRAHVPAPTRGRPSRSRLDR